MPRVAADRLMAAAAGAVAVTVALQVTLSRFGGEWGAGVRFAIVFVAAAVVLSMLLGSAQPGAIGTAQTVLVATGLLLTLGALSELADALGGSTDASGTVTWVFALFSGFAFWLAWNYRSAVAALFGALGTVVTVVAFVDWVFNPDSASTFRYVLLLLTILFIAAAFAKRADSRRHAAQFAIAAGVTALAVAATFAVGLLSGFPFGDGGRGLEVSTGWEIYLVLTGIAILALAYLEEQPGPGYMGGIVLLVFTVFAAMPDRDGPSLIGWPILLLIPAVGLLGYALAGSSAGRPTAGPSSPSGPSGPAGPSDSRTR